MDIAQISVNCFLTSVPFQLIYVVLPLLYMTFTMQTMFLPVYLNHRCNQRHCTITLDYIFQKFVRILNLLFLDYFSKILLYLHLSIGSMIFWAIQR